MTMMIMMTTTTMIILTTVTSATMIRLCLVFQDYSLNIYLRQRWVDPRLQFINYSRTEWLELDTKIMKKVWVPDTFFRNEKKGAFHDVTVPNRLMHLYRNGTIYYSMR